MVELERRRWRIMLVAAPVELLVVYRQPDVHDCELLGSLMFDAYRGTVDERHKTSAEAIDHVGKYFSGEFGEPLLDCSYMAVEADRPISVTLVSLDESAPLLAQVYTAPEHRNHGLANALIQLSINALVGKGFHTLDLVMTAGNEPAEHVYRKLGFEPVIEAGVGQS